MSSKSKSSATSLRRSGSPRRKKPLPPGPPRKRSSVRKKRPARGTFDDERDPPKRPRSLGSPKKRGRTLSRQSPSERRRAYSGVRSLPLDQSRGSQQFIVRNTERDRLRSEDRRIVDRPIFRGPDKDVLMDRDSLKKIVVKMRDTPTGNDTIKRDIINPEDINVVRRAGEGSRPIFDRDEIVNFGRNFEESERERKRAASRSPVHSGRRRSSTDHFRSREFMLEERSESFREYHGGRQSRELDSRIYERSREERSRYLSSHSIRDFSPERSDRYDGRDDHRSTRSPGSVRRRVSPRRHIDDYRPVRERSFERREPSVEPREELSRGRGRGFSFRGRDLSGSRAFPRPVERIIHPAPPVRLVRGAFLPRVPLRRLPLPPRLVRPIRVIRVIAPVIPVRPPVLPVRPPILPVRHPVIPPPF